MPNHIHLVIETREPNLGKGMHALHGAYARSYQTTIAGDASGVADLDRLREYIAPAADLAGVYAELVSGALLASA
ncbi:MAG TPA: hypothetical protein VH247_10025 [Thermoleophilaceae bacterium]|jgi:hypothetical protein|nr:hypothetical protein [Thermoleophilaceae bacterium]